MIVRFETERWPMKLARWFTKATGRTVRVIVIHDMEYEEKGTAAEDVAKYFATTDTKASAHICVDSNNVIQCVPDSSIAFAAPGANSDGIQVELAGYGRQTRGQWTDEYSMAMLQVAGDAVAQYCLKYDIPPIHLTNQELATGGRGIVGHYQVSEVYRLSDHTDPGPNFPWDIFIAIVEARITCHMDKLK